jgi:nicotinate-nucleotide pyrophosphorylase
LTALADAEQASTIATTRKKSRKSPWQACEARLHAKVECNDLDQCYKTAFKQATTVMADSLHNEPVNSIIARLNLKHSLIGTRKP